MAPVALATHSIAPSAKGAFKKHEQPKERLGKVPLIDLYSGGPDSSSAEYKLKQEIVAGLKGSDKLTVPGKDSDAEDRRFAYKRTLPTTILYDEQGLVLYDKLTTAPEYYLYNAELEILREYGPEIALRIFGHPTPETANVSAPNPQRTTPKKGLGRKQKWGDHDVGRFNGGVNAEEGLDGTHAVGPASLVELGAGSLRKTVHLIRSLARLPAARRGPVVNYYALDLDRSELVRTLEDLRAQEAKEGDENQWTVLGGKVALHGMWSTYDACLEFIGNGGLADKSVEGGPRCLMWLGSSIGSYDRGSAADFLAKATARSLRPGDTMLVSIDRRNDPADVALAYNDPAGLTRDFIMNGISHADRVLGGGVLDPAKFEYCCRYNSREGRHEAYYRAREDHVIAIPGEAQPIHLAAGELIHVEFSYKYSEREALELFDKAGLRVVQKWTDSTQRYDTWLVERPQFHFSKYSQALTGLPSLKEWGIMWEAWDTVTLSMIPTEMLHEKPIDLRHICLFYLGHVPAFADIHISNNLDEPHTNDRFSAIFERGIDPHMDDVTQCNPHSEVPERPEDWPAPDEVLRYKDAVAGRIRKIYEDVAAGELVMDRRLARMLWMTLEHTAMHLETLLYMLNQSPNTLPPAGFTRPDWYTLARDWDAEHERRGADLASKQLVRFEAGKVIHGHDDDEGQGLDVKAARPSSNTNDLNRQLGRPEFGWDNEHPRRVVETDSFSISALPITNAQFAGFLSATGGVGHVPASWIQLAEGEGYKVRTVYGPVDMRVAQHWPVQASGAQLAAYAGWKGGRLPTHAELRRFFDATAADPRANVGFRNWHPVPASLPRRDSDGTLLPGHNGGVWEWTSTAFMGYDGFKAEELYPGYSADFFDGKHSVILGGSWATMPSIAGRRSFVNWYQTGYPFVFGGARVVHDAKTKVAAV